MRFYLFVVPFLLWKDPRFCTQHLDCPRHQYCRRLLFHESGPGVCRDFPLKPVPIPITPHTPWK